MKTAIATIVIIAAVGLLAMACSDRPTPVDESQPTPAPTSTLAPLTLTPVPTASPTPTGSPDSDRAALVALYYAMDGPNWRNERNWLSATPISQWRGVYTDPNGRVTDLDLSNNQLSGEIPPELGSLANLTVLALPYNQLSGPIPPELGNLANLTTLSLGENQLSGEIPPELGSLANLTRLGLSGNHLSGCIPEGLPYVRDSDFSDLGLPFCTPTG